MLPGRENVSSAQRLDDLGKIKDHAPRSEHVHLPQDIGQNEVHDLLFCQDHRVFELRKHFPFLVTPFLRIFQQPNPICCNRSTTNLFMISFFSRTLYFLFLSLWINLWRAETSQQPISQTTWLESTPHYNHCNHYVAVL